MEELLKQFPPLPFGLKPKYIYIDGADVVGVVEEEKFVGFARWDAVSVSFSVYNIFPRMS